MIRILSAYQPIIEMEHGKSSNKAARQTIQCDRPRNLPISNFKISLATRWLEYFDTAFNVQDFSDSDIIC